MRIAERFIYFCGTVGFTVQQVNAVLSECTSIWIVDSIIRVHVRTTVQPHRKHPENKKSTDTVHQYSIPPSFAIGGEPSHLC